MRIRKTMHTFTMVALSAALIGTLGCEDDSSTGPSDGETFTATLTQLNGSGVSGDATFNVDGDSFAATLNGEGFVANILHSQHIHATASCPGATADVNSDGYVDVLEGLPSYGAILIPLDGNLSTQAAGNTNFPSSNGQGTLTYEVEATLADMLTDLRAPDPDPADATTKLEADGELDLSGRTVVVHGISAATALPATVGTLHGLSAQASLPVACGEIN